MVSFNKSIMLKIWLIMVLLVLVILWITGFVQTRALEQTFYKQHLEQLTLEGHRIVNSIQSTGDPREVGTFSHILGLNIMVINESGKVKECKGMGVDIPRGTAVNAFRHHGMPWGQQEFKKILRGESRCFMGRNAYIDQNVLSVGLPYRTEKENGIVMISAPLAPIADRLSALQRVTIYTGVGGIILATLLSLIFSRSVSSPLVKMNETALAISRGNYNSRLNFNREDEIGVLANTLNLLSAQLQEKIAAIERLDNMRRDFIANVSHELRTPLSVIQVSTEALADGLADTEEERQEYLNNIKAEISRLRRLVSEILDLRKLETGKVDFDFHSVNISELLEEIIHYYDPITLEKNISLVYSIQDGLPETLMANRDKVKQVFINLLDNAIRLTPSGGNIYIRAERQTNMVKFTVQDSGPGINEEEQELIWERFYKVDKSRSRAGSGTGLGLPLVKRIVEAHGGDIRVSSQPGHGATFIFTIPANI